MGQSGLESDPSSKASVEQSGGKNGLGHHARKLRTIVHHHARRHWEAFGRAVRAVWKIKPALHLSQESGCSERSAQYQIDGERKPTARAILAVNKAMLDDDR